MKELSFEGELNKLTTHTWGWGDRLYGCSRSNMDDPMGSPHDPTVVSESWFNKGSTI